MVANARREDGGTWPKVLGGVSQKFERRPSYGEGYGRKGASVIAMVALPAGTVTVLPQFTHVGQVARPPGSVRRVVRSVTT